jgi:hypothetical protein
MMGGETFILLKGPCLGPKSAKQAETRMSVLPTILSITGFGPRRTAAKSEKIPVWVVLPAIPLDMANSGKIAVSVIQITVLAAILAHYAAWEGRGKMT